MHLTNYSLNKTSEDWIDETEVEDPLLPNKCSKRTLTAMYAQLAEEQGEDKVEELKENLKRSVGATCAMMMNHI